jgi:hypothetical protein
MTEEIIEMSIGKIAWRRSLPNGAASHGDDPRRHAGYLQFVSPVSKHRTDRCGGCVENRCRLPVPSAGGPESRRPGFPIESESAVRNEPCGYDIDEGVARQAAGRHADSSRLRGSNEVWDVFTVTHPHVSDRRGNVRFAAK